ncbi:helix-turn-helix domain-containing protein [Streptomyces sp. NPDC058691]|uniref:helix-turn-helix domain-containing protein n=1 Tax=Streptomyces sp. NPDC058691 TaxID=3346601 RepID=UPI003662326D
METAAAAFGIGRTTAYDLARRGQFPCRVIRAGRLFRVNTSDRVKVLGIRATPTNASKD